MLAVPPLVAVPLRHVQFGTPGAAGQHAEQAVGDVLREDFTGNSATALNVITGGPLDRAALTAYATRLSDLGLQQAMLLLWVVTSAGMLGVALVLNTTGGTAGRLAGTGIARGPDRGSAPRAVQSA